MQELVETLLARDEIRTSAIARELAVVVTCETGRTKSGHPYLQEPAWVRFRDWVPHILADGGHVLTALTRVEEALAAERCTPAARAVVDDACTVIRQVVLTAAITAPPDLWLLRHVLAGFSRLGLSQRLLQGELLRVQDCQERLGLRKDEFVVDLRFLLSRGLLRLSTDGFRMAAHDAARACFAWRPLTEARLPSSVTGVWAAALDGTSTDGTDGVDDTTRAGLLALVHDPLPSSQRARGVFAPSPADIETGFRLVPLVLALRAREKTRAMLVDGHARAVFADPAIDDAARAVLRLAGVVDDAGTLTVVGRRVLERGPGPFGIIETYHAYLTQLDDILTRGRASVWVERSANVAASQDANRASFERANDALDRFSSDTGFTYRVFIEHALGKGEATRQRFARAGDTLTYVGADLEDAAIDAAIIEQGKRHLPASMLFVRHADIGDPAHLEAALAAAHIDPVGAVMIVGNGFHEVREQTDEKMTRILAGYAKLGIVLLFTEETGLAVDDLLNTAWNTYHAGFKYVHERSGQGLRPAEKRPPSPYDIGLPLSWVECAERAGYVRLDAYSPRGRTVYPYTPTSGHNPAITVTHFCVPRSLVERLLL
jgi:hypothetical protein